MRGKNFRVPIETYDKLKVLSAKHKTTMTDVLQRAVFELSIKELEHEARGSFVDTVPSDAELLTYLATILERRGRTLFYGGVHPGKDEDL